MKSIESIRQSVLNSVTLIAVVIAAFMLLISTVSVVIQIVMRYQNNPTLWSIELSQFAVIAMIFVGSAAAARDRQHFSVNYLAMLLGDRVEAVLDVVSRIVSLITLFILFLYTVEMLQSVMNTYSTAARFPVRYVYYFMIYGVASWIIVVFITRKSAKRL